MAVSYKNWELPNFAVKRYFWPFNSKSLIFWKDQSSSNYTLTYVLIKVARSDFWVTIPFNFDRPEHHNYQSNEKSNVTGVVEKNESFKNRVHFTKIGVSMATKWRHTLFYMRPNNLPHGVRFSKDPVKRPENIFWNESFKKSRVCSDL